MRMLFVCFTKQILVQRHFGVTGMCRHISKYVFNSEANSVCNRLL